MKKILSIILISLFMFGCSEEFLDVENKNELNSENFFNTKEQLDDALTTAYAILQWQGLFGVGYQFIYYALDDRTLHEDVFWERILFTSSVPDRLPPLYDALYAGVFRSNWVLDGIETTKENDPTFTKAQRDLVVGQALFLRGLFLFYQTLIFNEPPLITYVPEDYSATFANSDKEQFWAQIEADLDSAIQYLPWTWPNAELGRATKGAAYALKGKAHLYQQEWQDARNNLAEVINSDVYELVTPKGQDSSDYVNAYLCNFTRNNLVSYTGNVYQAENNSESVFEVQYGYDPNYWNFYIPGYGAPGHLLSAYFSATGWRNIAPTREFVAQFSQVPNDHPASNLTFDPRRPGSVFSEGDTIEYRTQFATYFGEVFSSTKYANPAISDGYGVRKYYFPLHLDNPDAPFHDPNNWRLIRYSDVLLMFAEADWHVNNGTVSQEGLEAFNLVRARVGMPQYQEPSEITPDVIVHERDIELGLECIRFHDLVRWTKVGGEWPDVSDHVAGFQVNKHEYLPIPLAEIQKMQGKLVQNPGW